MRHSTFLRLALTRIKHASWKATPEQSAALSKVYTPEAVKNFDATRPDKPGMFHNLARSMGIGGGFSPSYDKPMPYHPANTLQTPGMDMNMNTPKFAQPKPVAQAPQPQVASQQPPAATPPPALPPGTRVTPATPSGMSNAQLNPGSSYIQDTNGEIIGVQGAPRQPAQVAKAPAVGKIPETAAAQPAQQPATQPAQQSATQPAQQPAASPGAAAVNTTMASLLPTQAASLPANFRPGIDAMPKQPANQVAQAPAQAAPAVQPVANQAPAQQAAQPASSNALGATNTGITAGVQPGPLGKNEMLPKPDFEAAQQMATARGPQFTLNGNGKQMPVDANTATALSTGKINMPPSKLQRLVEFGNAHPDTAPGNAAQTAFHSAKARGDLRPANQLNPSQRREYDDLQNVYGSHPWDDHIQPWLRGIAKAMTPARPSGNPALFNYGRGGGLSVTQNRGTVDLDGGGQDVYRGGLLAGMKKQQSFMNNLEQIYMDTFFKAAACHLRVPESLVKGAFMGRALTAVGKASSPFLRNMGARTLRAVANTGKSIGSTFGGSNAALARQTAERGLAQAYRVGDQGAMDAMQAAAMKPMGRMERLYNWGRTGAQGANKMIQGAESEMSAVPRFLSKAPTLAADLINPKWGLPAMVGGYMVNRGDAMNEGANRAGAEFVNQAVNMPFMSRLGYLFNPGGVMQNMDPGMLRQMSPYFSPEAMSALQRQLASYQR